MKVGEREGGRRRGRGPHLPQEHHILPPPDPPFSSSCLIEGPAATERFFFFLEKNVISCWMEVGGGVGGYMYA